MAPSNTEERYDQIAREVKDLTVSNAQLTTVVREHLVQTKANMALHARQLEAQDERIRQLEKAQAIFEATKPKRWLDTDAVERAIDTLGSKVTDIDRTLAKWAAYIAVGSIALQLVGPPLVKFALATFGIHP